MEARANTALPDNTTFGSSSDADSTRRRLRFTLAIYGLILFGLCLRVAVYRPYSASEAHAEYHIDLHLYYLGVTDHLGEYLLRNTHRPPLTYLLHSLAYQFADGETAFRYRFLVLQLFLLDTAGLVLLLLALRHLRVPIRWSLPPLMLLSIALVPVEFWRNGWNYQQMTFFFGALYAWGLVRMLVDPRPRTMLVASACATLLILQAAMYGLVATIAFAFIAVVHAWRQSAEWKGRARACMAAWLCLGLVPFLVTATICTKNYMIAGIFSPSSQGGTIPLQVLQAVLRKEHDGGVLEADIAILNEAKTSGIAPAWWLWCFANARPMCNHQGRPYPGWGPMARSIGLCYPMRSPANRNAYPYFQLDLRPLIAQMKELDTPALVEALEQDWEELHRAPYLYAGFSPEEHARFHGHYGSISARVARYGLFTRPLGWARQILRAHRNFSAVFPRIVSNYIPPARGQALWQSYGGLFVWIGDLMYWLMLLAWPILGAVCLLVRYLDATVRADLRVTAAMDRLWHVACFAVSGLLVAFLYCSLVVSDHDRHFLEMLPFIFIAGPAVLRSLVQVAAAWMRPAVIPVAQA